MLVAIFLGVIWKKFTPKAAFWSMIIGGIFILLSVLFPQIIIPLAGTHGVTDGSEANIVFERVEDGPIMGPRAAYNAGEIFGSDKGKPTDWIVEYELKSEFDNIYDRSEQVYTRFDTLDGTVVQRFCAPLKELKPRDSYTFRIVNEKTGTVYDAVWDKGRDENKLPVIELVQQNEVPEDDRDDTSHFGFKTAGDYGYFRSVFGLIITLIFGVGISLFTKPKKDIDGLTVSTIMAAKRKFKQGEPHEEIGKPIKRARLDIFESDESIVYLSTQDMDQLLAVPGDLLYVADARKWMGGLRSVHVKAGEPHDEKGVVRLSSKSLDEGGLLENKDVRVEKVI